MIRVIGTARFNVDFRLDIDMTEDEWDLLSESDQNTYIDDCIGMNEMESAEMSDCDVWEVENIAEDSDK